ncbi:MAG: bifunctional phosphoribosylaminoimidazolecarboxamide formyltransferase/IMP cyclohydrolase [Bacteroidota bacterium]|nr:bifunctional phosphoribosylaminoimidazolecarboxamide formyltransferase/IMP cyclohydrolase [Candidatus Kapabacteria bacterium]MCS7303094.1 bifunctional phosphoribosylaminoimidazolecarboxamide formyltransferase/IMP cyclohydrolase [Candidatus Kapabacteria bacterium]MDW8075667.1 bifunctional phosphoribosylaminoimidazolecarboxamide formyltransferase/IMP cyclohydrolase [Bacteroidota bacterium]MDW8272276.1 bifunctional phosphoribosylaminoimidazolecarboxamide formyltransferase/IMP cyclohydrolase [Bac
METPPIQRALLSAWEKTGIVEFARELSALGVEILSTGGTARALRQAEIPVTLVETVTQMPELLDGRVKTLHPAIHAALLAQRDNLQHMEHLRQHGITPIDLVCVNFYPFAEAAAHSSDEEHITEMIDIGGPAMLRAAAKNYRWVVPVVLPEDYPSVLESIRTTGTVPLPLRRQLAAKAFQYTAWYDAQVAQYFEPSLVEHTYCTLSEPRRFDVRYGENPHQRAALFGAFDQAFLHIHGKELSYNNILDLDAAVQLVLEFSEPTVVIVKHTNPCGVGSGDTLTEAWEKAYATDTVSPFGGIVATNVPIDEEFAASIHPLFIELIAAPAFSEAALGVLTKKKDRRLIRFNTEAIEQYRRYSVVRSVTAGLLIQTPDVELLRSQDLQVVTEREPTDAEFQAMMFAWKVAKHAKSNAIVYARADRTLAIGAGQPSRVDSARIAAWKAQQFGLDLRGSAVASDAFFPFADGVIQCAEAGATAIIQPGGSIRDEEVIRAANERNIAMIFTGMRHFRH